MTDVELRVVDDADVPAVIEAFDRTFGLTTTPENVERASRTLEPGRTVAAWSADGEVVGTAGAYSFQMSLPFGAAAGCAGITRVSVRADHRRRGLLTRMMAWLLDDAAGRGEPFAALWASESPIYGRFGFGPAAPTVAIELDRRHAHLRVTGPVDDVVLVDGDRAAAAFPDLYRRAARSRPGLLSRSPVWWSARMLDDPPARRDGAGPMRYALLPDRGYAIYRLRPSWEEGVPLGTVEVEDLVALDPEADAALWRFVADTDLAVRLRAIRRPVDDPVLTTLVDPARARITYAWPLQLRLVDVAVALEARRYGVEGTCVLEVADTFRPANAGRYRLEVSGGSARCTRVGDDVEADLSLDAESLGSIYLGGVRTTQLHAAGRVRGAWDRAAALDRLLATERAPWHGGMF